MDNDKTDRKLAFLARRRGFLETVLQSVQEGVLVVSSEGNLDYANRTAEEMLGFELARQRSRPVERYLPGVDWAALASAAQEDGGAGLSTAEIEVFRPARRVLSVRAFPLEGGAGAVAVLRDVTREREDAREALESERMQAVRMLAASLAHEIGNPLNALGIHLQLLERAAKRLPDEADRAELGDCVRVARDEVDRLDGILSEFLNALRNGAPNLERCDVLEVLEKSLRVLRADVQERSIRIEVSHPASLPPITADRSQLQRVFFNLVKNALQAMPDGGTISIELAADDRDLSIAFRDSGTGIAPEEFVRLFEPFHTGRAGGHGIGLAIVRRIVEDHGGRIDVSSRPGRGACFRLTFPLADRAARRLPPAGR
ncbi:MAG: PAS domain-containing protein [Kiritimatiellae bacterium]|nr:PAS domain-containing protein [Kiritimatiellia bacterium]